MRDNLDLQELRERADSYTKQARRIRNRGYIIILGMLIVLGWIYLQTKDPIGGLYMVMDGEWERVNTYPVPIDMQVADDGTIWIQTVQNSSLSYIGRNEWDFVTEENFGSCCFEFNGIFTTYQYEIWAQSKTSLARYNNETWRVFNNYFPVSDIIELGVNSQGVFAIDSHNTLYWGQFERWDTIPLPESSASNTIVPSLIDIDGVMYLHYDGLWTFDDGTWDKVQDVSANSNFVGEIWGTIWINDNNLLMSYRPSTDQIATYAYDDIELPTDNPVEHVFVNYRNHNLYLATQDTIYQHHEGKWEFVETLDTPYGIQSIEVSPWGSWVVASTNLDLAKSALAPVYSLFSSLSLVILPFAIIILNAFVRSFPKYRIIRQRTERSHKLITSLLSDIPGEMRTPEALPSETSSKVRYFIGMSMFVIVPLVSSALNLSMIISLPSAVVIAVGILYLPDVKKAIKWNDKSLSARQARKGLRNYIGITILLVSTAFFVDIITPNIHNAGLLVLGAWIIFWWARNLYMRRKPSRFIPKSLHIADYDSALEVVTKSQIKASIGYVQMYAGNFEDAYQNYLETLQDLGNSTVYHHSVFLMNLGSTLDRMGKFEEALRFYEAAIVLIPESPIPYHNLAQAYNNNQIHPDRALEISQEMMRTVPTGSNPYMIRAEGEGIYSMTHALALANVGQFEEVQSYIDQAESSIDRDFILGLAGFYQTHARILLAMNQTDEAVALLKKAIEIDPNGDAGKLAKSVLHSVSLATNSDS